MSHRTCRYALVLASALSWAGAACAQSAGQLGLGAIVGDPLGLTAKYMVTKRDAIQTTIGVSNHFTVTADYVFHGWDLTPQPKKGPLALYLAGGVRIEPEPHHHDERTDIGFRSMLGVSYWPTLASRTGEFFLELGPTYRVTRDFRIRMEGGFGARIYFSPKAK